MSFHVVVVYFILIADFHFVCLHDLLIILFIDICGLYFAAIMNGVAMNIMCYMLLVNTYMHFR